MWIRLLRPGQFIPAGTHSSASLGVIQIVPRAGEAWRMLANLNNGTCILRGRFVNKDAAFTNITPQINTHAVFGAPTGLEAGLTAITSTTIVNSNTWWMPYLRLLANGTTAAGATDAIIMLGAGFPVADVRVVSAMAGMPWSAGQSLLDPALGLVETA